MRFAIVLSTAKVACLSLNFSMFLKATRIFYYHCLKTERTLLCVNFCAQCLSLFKPLERNILNLAVFRSPKVLEVSFLKAQVIQILLPLFREFIKLTVKLKTSRDRPKSAPYPRLKNSKKTFKCQVFSFTVLENRILYEKITHSKNGPSGAPGPASASPWRAERRKLPKLSTFLSQLKGFCRRTSKN